MRLGIVGIANNEDQPRRDRPNRRGWIAMDVAHEHPRRIPRIESGNLAVESLGWRDIGKLDRKSVATGSERRVFCMVPLSDRRRIDPQKGDVAGYLRNASRRVSLLDDIDLDLAVIPLRPLRRIVEFALDLHHIKEGDAIRRRRAGAGPKGSWASRFQRRW